MNNDCTMTDDLTMTGAGETCGKHGKNFLFDLGGVITDIRRLSCVEAFKTLGFADVEEYLGDYGQKGPFLAIEDGSITPAEFRTEMRRHIPRPVTDEEIDLAFNAFITGLPVERLRMLRALRAAGHRTYVISNTNPIMWARSLRTLFQQEGLERDDYFDGIVTSFEAGCCKPAEPIFRKVCDDFNIRPEETLFFDDSAENCRIAAGLGFRSVHVPEGADITDIIREFV